jgi:phage terminase large subunit-like protein
LSTLILTNLNGEKVDERRPVNIFTGVDPASSTKKTADFSVIFNIALDEHNNRFVLPYYRKRATPLALADAIITNFKLYRSTKTRIESVGYQEMLRQYIKEQSEQLGLFIPGLEVKENPRTSKSYRLESLQPLFANHKIYMTKSMLELENELMLYPRARNDDLLDGLFYANKNAYTPSHTVSSKSTEKEERRGFYRKIVDWRII